MNLFSEIKAAVTTRQAAEHYGLRVNRSGLICCPFHQDRHPSMKVDARYYCFSCHQTGDVIDFTAALFHTGPYEAARRLAADFNIPIHNDPPPRRRTERKPAAPYKPDLSSLSARLNAIRAEAARQEQEAWIRHAADTLAAYRLLLRGWMEQYAPKDGDEDWHPRFVEACADNELVDYLLSLIEDPQEHDFFCTQCRKEVNRIEEQLTRARTDDAV